MPNNKISQLKFEVYDSWPIPPRKQNSVFIDTLPGHIWTNTKAELIRNYLRYFQWVTKHGCYIDGFAGPQYEDEHESWAAKLVLEMEPKWFRNFFLCDIDPNSYQALKSMIKEQPGLKNREVVHHQGDFNSWVYEILKSGVITDTVATFALLDQRSTECNWRTVERLASHKKGQTKIELFYFYPTGWINRVISRKSEEELANWWGGDNWTVLKGMNQTMSAELMTSRIQDLGYYDVKAWPIYKLKDGQGRVMYHMIHATDHPKAPELMDKAYRRLVGTAQEIETIDMWEAEHLVASDIDSDE